MKPIVQTISVIVVLNLAIADFTLAQSPVETAPAVVVSKAPPPPPSALDIVQELYATKSSYAEAVLVIPAAEMKPEDLLAIMEDMNIMARIFDKQLAKAHLIQSREYSRFYRWAESTQSWGTLNNLFSKREGLATETIYLEDFGAIFLMKVDFPLVPPPKVEEKEAEEPTDRIWAQTKQEIYMPDAVKKSKGAPPAEAYDAEKVEKLKRTLISALKHASNIRALKQEQWVILTMIGWSGRPRGISGRAGQNCWACHALDQGGALAEKVNYKSFPTGMGFCLPAVLTICAKKSDIDAFAKGELKYEEFRQRTKIFTSYAKFGSGRFPDDKWHSSF